MSYTEWNTERLKGKWYQDRIKLHGSWDNYLAYISEKNKAGGYATKGVKKPGAGRFKKGDLEAKLLGKKGGDAKSANRELSTASED